MTTKTHDKFLKMDEMIESMFSENVDLFEQIVAKNVPEGEEITIGNVVINNDETAGLKIRSVGYHIENEFYLFPSRDGSFRVENFADEKMFWENGRVSIKFDIDVLEDFSIIMDNIRTFI